MTSVRTFQGCDIGYIEKNFGYDFSRHCLDHIESWCNTGHVTKDNNRIILTEKGKLFADRIAADMFIVE